MSRRRRAQPNSLELLLDTMCNTFGGIIMIALLVALLSRDASSDAAAAQQTETLRRQIQAVEQQTTEAGQLRQRLLQTIDPSSAATFELLAQRDALREQIDSLRETIQSSATTLATITATNDPAELERLIAQRQSQTNELRALQEQVDRDTLARQRQLRLPRERVTGKKTSYFIVRFGKIYPVHAMREGRRELNTQTIDWRQTPDGEIATPRRDAGIDATTGLPTIARLLNEIPAHVYSIHFLVFNDSFPAFLAARQIPLARNFDTGWEFFPEDRPIIFSSRGEAPPAL